MQLTQFPQFFEKIARPDGTISDMYFRSLEVFRQQVGGGFELNTNPGLATNIHQVGPGDSVILSPADELLAVQSLVTTGLTARTGTNTWVTRTLTGTTDSITVANGDGVSANPTASISSTYPGQTSIVTLGTITAGTWNGTAIDVSHGGTGATAVPTDGQLLIGNGTNYTVAALSAGAGISTTPGAGTLQINNTGVTSLIAGTNVSISSGTGDVTINVTGTVTATANLAGGVAGNIPYQSAPSTTAMLGTGTSSQVLISGTTPAWTNTPTLTGTNFTGIPNGALTNSSVTVNGTSISLGASGTVTAAAGTLTGTALNATVVTSSLTSVGTLTSVKTSGYTVATLPAGTIGMRAYVTNALAPTYGANVVGGGAVVIPVFYNGTAWIAA